MDRMYDPDGELFEEIWEDLPPFHTFSEVELDLFVELIVRECIKLVEPINEHREASQCYLGGSEGVQLLDATVDDIKKHFGIE